MTVPGNNLSLSVVIYIATCRHKGRTERFLGFHKYNWSTILFCKVVGTIVFGHTHEHRIITHCIGWTDKIDSQLNMGTFSRKREIFTTWLLMAHSVTMCDFRTAGLFCYGEVYIRNGHFSNPLGGIEDTHSAVQASPLVSARVLASAREKRPFLTTDIPLSPPWPFTDNQ